MRLSKPRNSHRKVTNSGAFGSIKSVTITIIISCGMGNIEGIKYDYGARVTLRTLQSVQFSSIIELGVSALPLVLPWACSA